MLKKFKTHVLYCQGEFFLLPIISFSTDKTIQGHHYLMLGWGIWAIMVCYDEPSNML